MDSSLPLKPTLMLLVTAVTAVAVGALYFADGSPEGVSAPPARPVAASPGRAVTTSSPPRTERSAGSAVSLRALEAEAQAPPLRPEDAEQVAREAEAVVAEADALIEAMGLPGGGPPGSAPDMPALQDEMARLSAQMAALRAQAEALAQTRF